METEALAAAREIDFSMLALFLRATITVKIVIVTLLLASFWSWSIIIQKLLNFRAARRDAETFQQDFWSGTPLDELFEHVRKNPSGGISERVFVAGMVEWRRSQRNGGGFMPGSQARIERAMDVSIAQAADSLTSGLTFLATVGSIAPFVGLFGTVWGIKNAFEEIAIQQNTNLAVVAPGIAEALVATALGLLAAIPAVVFYNKLSADANRLLSGHDSFASEFAAILSRHLEAGN